MLLQQQQQRQQAALQQQHQRAVQLAQQQQQQQQHAVGAAAGATAAAAREAAYLGSVAPVPSQPIAQYQRVAAAKNVAAAAAAAAVSKAESGLPAFLPIRSAQPPPQPQPQPQPQQPQPQPQQQPQQVAMVLSNHVEEQGERGSPEGLRLDGLWSEVPLTSPHPTNPSTALFALCPLASTFPPPSFLRSPSMPS